MPVRCGVRFGRTLSTLLAGACAFVLSGCEIVEPPGRPRARVGAAQAGAVAALATAVGAGLTALAVRRSARPQRLVLGLVVVGLLLFAANPVMAADQTLTVVALEVMHLAVAGAFLAVVLPALARRRHGRP